MRKTAAAAILVLVVVATGCIVQETPLNASGNSMSPPTITVTDLAGRSITFEQPIERIVLVRGRDIYTLGMLLGSEIEEKLVAWGPDFELYDGDSYRKFVQSYPRLAEVPNLGSVYHDAVSVEQVLALAPDLVIVDTFMGRSGLQVRRPPGTIRSAGPFPRFLGRPFSESAA